ncbi:hypothetical protein [Galbitalea soli]|uniref:Uncharacterized protein n=1 Tax=Galbitalea soli TaxID=1268042 RepID=A0A7C9TQR2_9MICO|nr:hypothetical protein [Galbitalea soli]NEM90483.1 hypothetical protein [Galbitalea soli]NYJ31195.1 hypothetical protein [Galbitalea soli]
MKRIYYASGSVVTGDRTADAVVRYAEALASRVTSDTIAVPVRLADGTAGIAQLLIGPASQLVVVPEPQLTDETDDEAVLDELSLKTLRLSSPHPQPIDAQPNVYYAEGNDYNDALGDDLP